MRTLRGLLLCLCASIISYTLCLLRSSVLLRLGLVCVCVLLLLCTVDERFCLVFGLVFLGAKIVGDSVQNILLDLEDGIETCKGQGEETVPTIVTAGGFVVLFAPSAVQIVTPFASELERVVGVASGGIDDFLSVFLDDREGLVKLA